MNISKIKIKGKDLRKMVKIAKKDFPLESAVLLFGKFENDEAVIAKLVEPRYSQRDEKSFTIEPIFLYEALTKANEEGFDLVAIFHSHPSSPYPSARDLEFMKLNPVIWIILSMPSEQLNAFVLKNNEIRKVKIKVV
jgi:proteasome lid subunit RPN8/RPN11